MMPSIPGGDSSLRPPARLLVMLALGSLLGGCGLFVAPQPSTPSPTTSATPNPTATGTSSPTAAPLPTGSPPLLACGPGVLAARISQWDGATGHRIATIELTNIGAIPCVIGALAQPQLVDAPGTVLIDGAPPPPAAALALDPGGVLTTLVQGSNYCGPAPIPPVTVAFILSGGAGRIVAVPLTPTDTSGVPPCLGPGGPGSIEMQPWGPSP